MKRESLTLFAKLMIFLVAVVFFSVTVTWVSVAEGQTLPPEAIDNFKAQFEILIAEKQSCTQVQQKVNFSIIRYLHVNILQDRQETLPKNQNKITLTANNEVLTDIDATVSDSVLEIITDNGGTIINQFPEYRAIRALIPITAVEVIAAHPDIQFIDKAAIAITRKVTTSEGDVAHNAPLVRKKGFTGSGVKVGVLSDSVDNLAAVQATGDLPPVVTVLADAPGNTGEGTAMLEVVHDLAPDSPLAFATAWRSPAGFAHNIIELARSGCKVMVDDVGWSNESPFQDDVISRAVSRVTRDGMLYFSSAGNEGNLLAGTSGTWEGDYVYAWDVGGWHLHAFAPGTIANLMLSNPEWITLQWSDPLKASGNDYDLVVVDILGNIVNFSMNFQNGFFDPYEMIEVNTAVPPLNYTGHFIVIGKFFLHDDRFLHLNACRAQTQYATNGTISGHPTVESAFAVSAVSARLRTDPFTGAEPLEPFTSDGPRRVFYHPDGTPITPGNFSSTGGYVRMKPDITAADGVACSAPGFNPFWGTSAAAPHAAAITALLLSAKPTATQAQIWKALTKSALPAPAVWNNVAGYGIVMADRAWWRLMYGRMFIPFMLLLD
jgi:subtilisin family serine protease